MSTKELKEPKSYIVLETVLPLPMTVVKTNNTNTVKLCLYQLRCILTQRSEVFLYKF